VHAHKRYNGTGAESHFCIIYNANPNPNPSNPNAGKMRLCTSARYN